MKLLASPTPQDSTITELIPRLPRKRVVADKVIDQNGMGSWFEGRVLFISNAEVVIVPTRCKATNIFGAASRMPRAAKTGLPKRQRRGNDNRLRKVIVEMVEWVKK